MIDPIYLLQNSYLISAKNIIKAALVFLLSLIFISFTETKEPESLYNDLYFDNLKGEIERVEEIPHKTDSIREMDDIDSCCITITEYDTKGYRIRQYNKDRNGNEKSGQNYISRYKDGKPREIQFTENGKLISVLSGNLNKMGKYGDTQIYDSSGRLQFYYSGIAVNEYGKIILMKRFSPDNSLQQTIINKYNKQIWVGGYIKDSSGKEVFSTIISLNEKMNPVEVKQTRMMNSSPDITTTKYAYSLYDNHGNWIKCHEIDKKGNILKVLKRKITYRQTLSSKYQSPVPKD